jgi:hypothetical protein
MIVTVAGRSLEGYMSKLTKKIVRTYKGDVERNQLGHVLKFPASFITLGFDIELTGLRSELKIIQQLLLGSDTFMFVVSGVHDSDYKGLFSATTADMEDLSDKNEEKATLTVSIVSVDGAITHADGSKFGIKLYGAGTVVASGYFGDEVSVPSTYQNYSVVNSVTEVKAGKLGSSVVLLDDVWIGS